MPINYTAPQTYAWGPLSPRPAKPLAFSQALVERFLASDYAQNTSLAAFILANPNALTNGVLNQLHRRHIIPWDLIKSFTAKAAATDFNHNVWGMVSNIFLFFNVDNPARLARDMAHGAPRAAAWTQIANAMCWVESNVFVGQSAGNIGVDIDQGDELSDNERRDLMIGAAWQGAAIVFGGMQGFSRG